MTEEKPKRTRKPKSDFPKECCGVCKFSRMEEKQLTCYGSSPFLYYDEVEVKYDRGAPVEALDPICALFKPKEMG